MTPAPLARTRFYSIRTSAPRLGALLVPWKEVCESEEIDNEGLEHSTNRHFLLVSGDGGTQRAHARSGRIEGNL